MSLPDVEDVHPPNIEPVSPAVGFRARVRQIISSEYTERFVVLVIFANCVALGFESNRPGFSDTATGKAEGILETVFLLLFTVEMMLKMVAFGCINAPDSYFRERWNWLDFIVVIFGWIKFIPSVGNYTSLRAIRVFRSLRTITTIRGMRKLVSALLKSLPLLFDVLLLCAFAFFTFGIIGVQVFSGALRHRCGCPIDLVKEYEIESIPTGEICDDAKVSGEIQWSVVQGHLLAVNEHGSFVETFLCPSQTTQDCSDGVYCADVGNPFHGIVSFDNILFAWLSIFQVISLEGWTDMMYMYQDAVSPFSWMYFSVLIVFGSFFAVNLALAVLYMHFSCSDNMTEYAGSTSEASGLQLTRSIPSVTDAVVPWRRRIKAWCYRLQESVYMQGVTTMFIAINVAVMAANHYRMEDWQKRLETTVNTIVAFYFLIEMIIKVEGLGWRGYISDRSNIFDMVIVVTGMLEFLVSMFGSSTGIGGWVYALRAFRILRIFKLSRSWQALNSIVTIIQGSIGSMLNLILLFFIFIVVMALLGMQLFGYRLHFCDDVPGSNAICPPGVTDCPDHPDCHYPCTASEINTWIEIYDSPYNGYGYCQKFEPGNEYWAQVGPSKVPRHNFDSFIWAFLTVFQILTGENWNEVMYDVMRSTSYIAMLYCTLIIVIGNYIILNLFLAVLLENFEGSMDEDEPRPDMEAPLMPSTDSNTPNGINGSSSRNPSRGVIMPQAFRTQSIPPVLVRPLTGNALFFFTPHNPYRRLAHRIVNNLWFERIIIVIIIASSVMLALESPRMDKDSFLAEFISHTDAVFVIFFAIEATLRITDAGFLFNGPTSYLRDRWNILDFFILIIGIFFQCASWTGKFKALRVLRALRCLKSLRLATRNKGLRVAINSLFQSVPPLMNVVLVCLLFFLTFAIFGISMFKGEYYFCADSEGERIDADFIDQKVDKNWCDLHHHVIDSSPYHRSHNLLDDFPAYTLNHEWKNRRLNFDWLGTAMLTMFEMSTLEMWLGAMYNGIDAVGIGKQPVRDHTPAIAMFFVCFIIIGAFFVLNLFVSVTIDKFHKIKTKQEGRLYFLTKEQQDWVITLRYLWVARPLRHFVPPKTSWRRLIFDGVNSTSFDSLVFSVIFINVIAMSSTYYDMDHSFRYAITIINFVCTVFFVSEVIVKLIAYGFRNYFLDRWNVFDFVLTALSFGGSPMLVPRNIPVVSVLRVFRVARLLRVIPKATGLRTLFQTLAFSFPALVDVGVILSLFFFIYAVAGVQLFGTVKRNGLLDEHANFENFGRALLTLFRMSTGESWNGIMHDAIVHSDCIQLKKDVESREDLHAGDYLSPKDPILDSLTGDDDIIDRCNSQALLTIFYFSSFILIVAFILLNVVIAVILDNFQSSARREQLIVKLEHIEAFAKVWSELDPEGTWYAPVQKLPLLLLELPPPLGTKGTPGGMSDAVSIILTLDVPDRCSRIHFLETLYGLMHAAAGTDLPYEEENLIRERMQHLLPRGTEEVRYTVAHYHSAKYLQASIRGFLIRERLTREIKSRINTRGLQRHRTIFPRSQR